MKMARVLVLAGMLVAVASSAWAADPLAEQMKAQNKLLAQRAARADAIRKLAERIKGLHITSSTTVKDFVTTNDQIETALVAFLTGVREAAPPKYMEDGTCELKMEVTLVTVVENLKEIHNRYYKGNKFKSEDFVQMTQTNDVKVISETGMGAPRPAWTPEEQFQPVAKEGTLESLDYMGPKAKKFWLDQVQPQGRLGAVRAARVDGMRKLAERIKSVYITSNTRVVDFVTESDQINAVTQTILKGARERAIRYHEDELIVEVEMEVTLQTVYETVKSQFDAKYKGDKAQINSFEERIQKVKNDIISETGMGVPNPKYLKQGPAAEMAAVMIEAAPKWPATIQATGNAAIDKTNDNAAQAKLMAFRGAELDARRKLAEEINGLMITSKTSVKDFVTQNDEIQTAMLTFQQGARVIEDSKKVSEDGTVSVTVEIDPQPLWEIVSHYQAKLSIKLK